MKTISLKKVSAIAVASLGFGLLSVVPAQAVAVTSAYTVVATAPTVNTTSTTASAALATVTATIVITTTGNAGDTFTIAPSFKLLDPNGTDVTGTATFTSPANNSLLTSISNTAGAYAATITGNAAASNLGVINFTPTMGGIYRMSVTAAAGTRTVGTTDTLAAVTADTLMTGSMHVSGIRVSQGTTRGGTGAAGVANQAQVFVTLPAQTAAQNYKFTSSGVGTISGAEPVNGVNTNITGSASDFSAGLTMLTTANTTLTTQLLTLTNATTPGVQTIAVTSIAPSTGLATALYSTTITWGAVAAVGTVSAGNSTSILSTDVATPFVGTADETISVPSTVNNAAYKATIKVILNDTQATPAAIATKAVTATISGSGLLGGSIGTGTTLAYTDATITGTIGRSITVNTDALGQAFFGVFADGSSGKGTITITQGTTTIATETVTFYGAVASFKATVKKNVVASGGATTAALDVVALDANSNVVPSVGISVTSGTPATIASFTETTSSVAEAAAGTAVVDVTGASATFGSVVLTIKDTATGLISTTATVKVGALEAATVTAAFDKTSYTPGALVTLTLTAKDVNGADVGDSITATSLVITTNAAVQGTLPTSTGFVLGKQVITFYAPSVGIPLTASVKLASGAAWSTALDDTSITATAAITDANAGLVTMIDALNAKIVALNALIAKIMKKLGVK